MRYRIKIFSAFAVVLVARSLAQGTPPQEAVIHVDVAGLRNSKGQVLCALYASAEGFPKDSQKAILRQTSSISEKNASCEFSGMAPGLMPYRYFTMRIPTASWTRIFWECLAKALALPMTPKATWVHPSSMLPNSNFPEAGSTSRFRSITYSGALCVRIFFPHGR